MNNIKVIEKVGKLSGSTIVVLAGVHGNEQAGVVAINNLSTKLKVDKGKIIFIVANLKAIENNKRFIENDLNRCFLDEQPEDIINSLEGRTAREIMPFLKKADFVLDLHQSNSLNSKPFIICNGKNVDLTKFFPISRVTVGWESFYPGASDSFVNLHGGKALGVELGSVNEKDCHSLAEQIIVNFLSGFGFMQRKAEIFNDKEFFKVKNVYKNMKSSFVKLRDFDDFEVLSGDCIIGKEGEDIVKGDNGDIITFVRDRDKLNIECFVILSRLDVTLSS